MILRFKGDQRQGKMEVTAVRGGIVDTLKQMSTLQSHLAILVYAARYLIHVVRLHNHWLMQQKTGKIAALTNGYAA